MLLDAGYLIRLYNTAKEAAVLLGESGLGGDLGERLAGLLEVLGLELENWMDGLYWDESVGVEWDGELLKIVIQDVPPGRYHHKEAANRWSRIVASACCEVDVPMLGRIVVLIRVFSNRGVADPDNWVVSPIINGLRYARVIPDDTMRYVVFAVVGIPGSDNPRTEIYVTKWRNAAKLLARCWM